VTAEVQSAVGVDAEKEWFELVEEHLPVRHTDSAWRSAPAALSQVPDQGWKLHISATVLSAAEVLRRIADVLNKSSIHWKAAATLDEVCKLNCGLYYGYSQIGKIFTLYPGDADVTLGLARELDGALTGLDGPRVPFDNLLRAGSLVHYRYGVLKPTSFVDVEGVELPALRDPQGRLVADRRGAGLAVPDWVPALVHDSPSQTRRGPLATRYVTYEAITQRGKGGTYRALDFGAQPVRRCVVREGRRHGETDWAGRDGRDRVGHELHVLRELSRGNILVPEVLDDFVWDGHQYLILEFLDGPDLQRQLAGLGAANTVDGLIGIARQAAELVANLHSAGWAWRDCKPANMVVTPHGVYAVDFEGACLLDAPDPAPWGSPGHVPPEWPTGARPMAQDLYALGAVIAAIFDKLTEWDPTTASSGKRIAAELQQEDPSRRPPASRVLSEL
jgi:tRNA A-37 threonylcarbamoyl transferase component Bud32